jgi:hypothetical protein
MMVGQSVPKNENLIFIATAPLLRKTVMTVSGIRLSANQFSTVSLPNGHSIRERIIVLCAASKHPGGLAAGHLRAEGTVLEEIGVHAETAGEPSLYRFASIAMGEPRTISKRSDSAYCSCSVLPGPSSDHRR